jgi:branched-subunit amino acid ABC-type transport system permease component
MSVLQVLYQFGNSFSFLIIASMGLAIIYGMMGIINFAHGEFIMISAFITTALAVRGVPLPLAIIIASAITGIIGLVLDRLIISKLYSRPLDSIVATWGISLIIKQGIALFMTETTGNLALTGVSTPFGSIKTQGGSFSVYRMLLMLISVLLVVTIYVLFMHTKFGLQSRATMQRSDIAASLGVNTNKIYGLTFMIGSMLAGLAGGLFAPTMSVTPDFGAPFLMPSFITVLMGGANPLIGTVVSGCSLGTVDSVVTILTTAFYGTMAMLIVAILFIRVFPKGFSDLIENKLLKRKKS